MAILAAVTALTSLACQPAVVNGDGLGYLKAALTPAIYPGHLGYLPLLRAARALAGAGPHAVDGLQSARVVSALAAALAVLALGAAARRLTSARGGTVAAAGLAASFGLIVSGSDVESYAPALAALCVAVYAIALRRSFPGPGPERGKLAGAAVVVAAVGVVAAVLFHIENALFVLPAFIALPRSARAPFIAVVAAVLGVAFALSGLEILALRSASHGFRYPVTWATPAIAVYGACKALVFAPYPYEASWPRVLGHFLLGAAALSALTAIVVVSRPATRVPLGRAATLAWALPYTAVGVAFFASDAERWIFLLPLFWLTVATAASVERHYRAALAVAGFLALANAVVWLPRARDTTLRDRAAAAARHTRPGDLIVSPGHGWDEYLGFYDGPPVEPFPLVYYAALHPDRATLRSVLADHAAARRVLLVRFTADDSPMGWKELIQFGISPANAAALLPPGTRRPLGDGVELLER